MCIGCSLLSVCVFVVDMVVCMLWLSFAGVCVDINYRNVIGV